MKLGTLKGKIVIGAVAFGLVSGVGTAFASTDAGTQLQNWYNSNFAKASVETTAVATVYGVGKLSNFGRDVETLKNTTLNNIKSSEANEISTSNEAINAAAQSHITAIGSTGETISAGMQGEFDEVASNNKKLQDEEIAIMGVLNRVRTAMAVDNQGKKSVENVSKEVTKTKEDAVKALQAKIDTTKAQLTQLLQEKKNATIESLKQYIDAQIAAKLAEIKAFTEQLEAAKKALIEAKGLEIENQAKADLDALVNAMNKK